MPNDEFKPGDRDRIRTDKDSPPDFDVVPTMDWDGKIQMLQCVGIRWWVPNTRVEMYPKFWKKVEDGK